MLDDLSCFEALTISKHMHLFLVMHVAVYFAPYVIYASKL